MKKITLALPAANELVRSTVPIATPTVVQDVIFFPRGPTTPTDQFQLQRIPIPMNFPRPTDAALSTRTQLLGLLHAAKKSIDLTAYQLEDPILVHLGLIPAVRKGVKIRIIADRSRAAKPKSFVKSLQSLLQIRLSNPVANLQIRLSNPVANQVSIRFLNLQTSRGYCTAQNTSPLTRGHLDTCAISLECVVFVCGSAPAVSVCVCDRCCVVLALSMT